MANSQTMNRVFTVREMIADTTPTPPEIIGRGVLPTDCVLMIVGKQKVGKSLFVTNLALHLAKGEQFLSLPIQSPHRVLMLAAEGGYFTMRDRVRRMAKAINMTEEESDRVAVFSCANLCSLDNQGMEDLSHMIVTHKAEILVIDPLVKFHAAEENSAKEMTVVLRNIRKLITDHGVAVILVHHQGKGKEGNVRGSSAISGEYDSCIALVPSKEPGVIRMSLELRHAETPPSTKLRLNKGFLVFGLAGEGSDIERLAKPGPLARQQLALQLQAESGIASSTAYKWISNAIKKGQLVELAGDLVGLPNFCNN